MVRAVKWLFFFGTLLFTVVFLAAGNSVTLWRQAPSVAEAPVSAPKGGGAEEARHPAKLPPEMVSETGPLAPAVDLKAVLAALTSGSRFVGTENNIAAGEYLEGMLREIGVEPLWPDGYRRSYRQTVGGKEYTPFNVAGRIRGRESGRAVVLSAHFDSTPDTPGAVDNASGCAALLWIAEKLASQGIPATDIVFCFFNGEEQFYIGSGAFVPILAEMYGTLYNINIDSVGMKGGGSYMMGSRPDDLSAGLVSALRETVEQYGLPCNELSNADVNSDHKSFWRQGYPGVVLCQENIYSICHTGQDTMDLIDYVGLERLGGAVTDFVLSGGGMIETE